MQIWKFLSEHRLTLEQKELCRSRLKLLTYLDRLETYEVSSEFSHHRYSFNFCITSSYTFLLFIAVLMFMALLKSYSLSLEKCKRFSVQVTVFLLFTVSKGWLLVLRGAVGQKPALNILCLQGIELCNYMRCRVQAGLLWYPCQSNWQVLCRFSNK